MGKEHKEYEEYEEYEEEIQIFLILLCFEKLSDS